MVQNEETKEMRLQNKAIMKHPSMSFSTLTVPPYSSNVVLKAEVLLSSLKFPKKYR